MSSYLALNHKGNYNEAVLNPNSSIEELLTESKLDFQYEKSPVQWQQNGATQTEPKAFVISRSDDARYLATVGKEFKPVQPREIVTFYKQLCERGDFSLEALGQVDHGARIWGLAKNNLTARIMGQDAIDSYLFFVTGNDGSLATRIKFLSKRLICNNMLNAAITTKGIGGWSLCYRHSMSIPYEQILKDMRELPDYWNDFTHKIDVMANKSIADEDAYKFFWKMYERDQDKPETIARRVEKVMSIFSHEETQQLRSTKNTLWGCINAVTYFNDHVRKNRTDESRFKSTMMGVGEKEKELAWKNALELVA